MGYGLRDIFALDGETMNIPLDTHEKSIGGTVDELIEGDDVAVILADKAGDRGDEAFFILAGDLQYCGSHISVVSGI